MNPKLKNEVDGYFQKYHIDKSRDQREQMTKTKEIEDPNIYQDFMSCEEE